MKVPEPEGLRPDPATQWSHPVLIFYAEHGVIPRNSMESTRTASVIKQLVIAEIYMCFGFLYGKHSN